MGEAGEALRKPKGHKLRAAKTSNRMPEAVISFHHRSGCGPCLDGSMRAMAFPSLTASIVEGGRTPWRAQLVATCA